MLGFVLSGSQLVGGISWGWSVDLLFMCSCFHYFFYVFDCFSYVSSSDSCYCHSLCFGVVVGSCVVFGGYVSDIFSFFPYYMGDYVIADFELFFDELIFAVGWLV